MLGTIVNTASIVVCSVIGLFLRGAEKYEKTVIAAVALGVVFIGASGVIKGLAETSTVLFMLYLVIGAVIGEFIGIENKFNRLGQFLGNKFGNSGSFSKGFVTASLIYCVGAMSIIGALEDSLAGSPTILFTKSVMDGVTALILSSIYGVGVLFSAFSVFIYQGAFSMLARFVSPIITTDALTEISTVGSVLIAAIGIDMLEMVKIKYANMLPAMFLPVFYYLPAVQNIISAITRVFAI